MLGVEHSDHIADVLFVCNAVSGFGWKVHFAFEMGRQLGKECDPGLGLEVVPPQQGLDRQGGLRGRHPLSEPRREVRVLAQGIEFARQDLIQVRNAQNTIVDASSLRKDVAVSGTINVSDLIQTRNAQNMSVAACP